MEAASCLTVTLTCPNKTVDLRTGQAVTSYISIATGSLSCVGALLIIYTYFAFKDLRTSAQTVITLLAVADLAVSLLYIITSILYFVYRGETDQQKCKVYDILCTLLAYGVVWSVWSVFIWNSALALHFCLLLFHHVTLANRLIPVYNIIGWGLPIAVALPMLVLGKLGKNPGQPESDCFLRLSPQTSTVEIAVLLGSSVWLPEIVSYLFIATLYGIIIVQICRKRLQGHLSRSAVPVRLLLIPFFYFASRIWDIVFFSVVLANPSDACNSTSAEMAIENATDFMRALGSGSQGFLNSILFVFSSKEMRKRLFYLPLQRVAVKLRRVNEEQQQTDTTSPLIVQAEDHDQQQLHADGRTSTYFSIPTEFSHSDIGNARHITEQMPQQANEMNSFPTKRLRVEWSCTHLSLPSEFPSSDVGEPELPPESHSELEESFTYFSLPSEFPSEMKPSEDSAKFLM